MHEFSICQNLVEAIVQEMEQLQPKPSRLIKARVAVGHLRQIVPEYLQFAYETLIKDTPAQTSELVVRAVPLRVACKKCAWEGEIKPQRFQCLACGSSELDMKSGMELYLENLEIEVDDGEGD